MLRKNSQFSCKQTLIDKRQWQFSLNFSLQAIENIWVEWSLAIWFWPFVTLNFLLFFCRPIHSNAKRSKTVVTFQVAWMRFAGRFSYRLTCQKIALVCDAQCKCIIYVWCSQLATAQMESSSLKKCTQHRLYVWCWCTNRFNAVKHYIQSMFVEARCVSHFFFSLDLVAIGASAGNVADSWCTTRHRRMLKMERKI